MVFEESVFEFWIDLSVIEGFGFGQEINGDVGCAQQIGFLDNRSGEGCILKGCALEVGVNQFGFTQIGEMQFSFEKIGVGKVGPGK